MGFRGAMRLGVWGLDVRCLGVSGLYGSLAFPVRDRPSAMSAGQEAARPLRTGRQPTAS